MKLALPPGWSPIEGYSLLLDFTPGIAEDNKRRLQRDWDKESIPIIFDEAAETPTKAYINEFFPKPKSENQEENPLEI